MINIEILHKDDVVVGINVVGHAGYAPYGQDVVCAAVSAASDMLLIGLLEVLKIDVEYCEDSGIMYCVLKDKDAKNERAIKAHTLLKSFHEYIKRVEVEQPKFVKTTDFFFTNNKE